MSHFQELYDRAAGAARQHAGEIPAPGLREKVHRLYASATRRPYSLHEVKKALVELLAYLASAEGRTSANCWAVDLFVADYDNQWEADWADLPEPFTDVLGDMSHALHDTVQAPDIAGNFDSTPEQLLDRAQQLKVE